MKTLKKRLRVLFLCTGNSCRSQMAEGWTRKLRNDLIKVYSAGVETHGLNPNAVEVMAEAGVDISNQHSKRVDEFRDIELDAVITVCGHAHETCPHFPPRCRVIHVGFDDPPKMAKKLASKRINQAGQLDCYRKVRDEIRAFVENMPKNIFNPKSNCSHYSCATNARSSSLFMKFI